jgi:hypothetical protein
MIAKHAHPRSASRNGILTRVGHRLTSPDGGVGPDAGRCDIGRPGVDADSDDRARSSDTVITSLCRRSAFFGGSFTNKEKRDLTSPPTCLSTL